MKTRNVIKKTGIKIFSLAMVMSLVGATAAYANKSPKFDATQAQNFIGEAKAKSIALEHAGVQESDIVFTKLMLDKDHGVIEYEVEFQKGIDEYEYEIDANTGAILQYDFDKKDIAMTQVDSGTYIGDDAAISIALQHAKISANDAEGVKSRLKTDDGRKVYNVRWKVGSAKYKYEISATDGAIWEYEMGNKR